MKVIKRDGTQQNFDTERILTAIKTAAMVVGYKEDRAYSIADEVTTKVIFKVRDTDKGITVEGIQDKVEKVLMLSKWKDIAKCYISYRSERDRVREEKSSYVKWVLIF